MRTSSQHEDEVRGWGNPTFIEVDRIYREPGRIDNWAYVAIVLSRDFTVITDEEEYRLEWNYPEQKERDYALFFEVIKKVISTLRFTDENYAKYVLPQVYGLLDNTSIFKAIAQKQSQTQGLPVLHHVKKVPEVVDTSECNLNERFILRCAAIFHDFGKMFNIEPDQLHLHALIGSDMFRRFMYEKEVEITQFLTMAEPSLHKSLRSSTDQAAEIIRLHHILEQVDKRRLTVHTAAEIFRDCAVNPFLMGLFVVADGGSVIADNELYSKFLIDNLNALSQIIDVLEQLNMGGADDEQLSNSENAIESKEVILIFVQALQNLLKTISTKSHELTEKIKDIVAEIAERIDRVLAVALLSL